MTEARRISATEAEARTRGGSSLLVCIYDDDKFYNQAHLQGAIPYSEFLRKKPNLGKSADIIFY